ncbi:unnamed protein product, partial [Mesorhabditis spiculigera]
MRSSLYEEKDIAVYKIPSAEDDNLDTSLTTGATKRPKGWKPRSRARLATREYKKFNRNIPCHLTPKKTSTEIP